MHVCNIEKAWSEGKKLKPRVLVCVSDLLPVSQAFINEQVNALERWEVVYFAFNKLDEGFKLQNVRAVILYPVNRVKKAICKCFHWIAGFRFVPFDLLVQELKIDIIHVHFSTFFVKMWPLLVQTQLPIVVTLHGYDINIYKDWFESGGAGYLNKKYPSMLVELAKERRIKFIAVSSAIKRRAIEYGIPEEKIVVSYIGVDTGAFFPSGNLIENRNIVLFVGRLVEKKGCNYLIEAFALSGLIQKGFRLVIAGDGPMLAQLRSISQELGASVQFLGAVSHEQVKSLISEARVFCLPSVKACNGDAEGLPIVILEAQASGVPVVTSANGGVEEGIINQKTGFSHREKDVYELSEALQALCMSDEILKSYSIAAREFAVQSMNLLDCTANLERIYGDCHERQS